MNERKRKKRKKLKEKAKTAKDEEKESKLPAVRAKAAEEETAKLPGGFESTGAREMLKKAARERRKAMRLSDSDEEAFPSDSW